MATTKRPSAKPATLKGPSETPMHPFRALWSAVAVVMLLVLSVPMFMSAVDAQSVDSTPLGTQTLALISALGQLGEQVGLLKTEVQTLRGTLADQQKTTSPQLAEGMPVCLSTCRSKLSQCLAKQATSTTPLTFTQFVPSPVATQVLPLDRCRTDANNCMNSCKPQPVTALSCLDRCAVALAGCVDAAGNQAKLAECRKSNQQCLVSACLKKVADAASMSRIPASVCGEQCTRGLTICRAAASLDSDLQAACDASARKCLSVMCNASANLPPTTNDQGSSQGQTGSGSPVGAAPAPGQTITVNCENDCSTKFFTCRDQATATGAPLSTCDAPYGSCREACLNLIGGGYVSSSPTVGAAPANPSPNGQGASQCKTDCDAKYASCNAQFANNPTVVNPCTGKRDTCYASCTQTFGAAP